MTPAKNRRPHFRVLLARVLTREQCQLIADCCRMQRKEEKLARQLAAALRQSKTLETK